MLGGEVGGCGGGLGFVDVDFEGGVVGADAVDQGEGFGEVVQGVEEDYWGLRCVGGGGAGEFGEHVEGDEASEAEGGGLVEVREGC